MDKGNEWMIYLLGIGGIVGGISIGYFLVPELLKLFGAQGQRPKQAIILENPGQKTIPFVESVKTGQNPYRTDVTNLRAKFMYDKSKPGREPIMGIPVEKLRGRYSGN